jgi:hypothetical protein
MNGILIGDRVLDKSERDEIVLAGRGGQTEACATFVWGGIFPSGAQAISYFDVEVSWITVLRH